MNIISGSKAVCRNMHRIVRLRLPRLLWQFASMMIAGGGLLLKWGFIGRAGMGRIWKYAELFERWADGFRRRGH